MQREPESNSYKFLLFEIASALLVFGDLRLVKDILNNAQYIGHAVNRKRMLGAIKELIPIPPEINLTQHPAILDWIAQHKDRLTWSEIDGKFLLKTE